MNHWNTRAALDRLEETRGHERALTQLAHDPLSRCLRLGPGLEIPAVDGELVSEIFDGDRRPDDLLLGRMDGHIWWARSDGEGGTDLRTLDLPPGQTQLAMMATSTKIGRASCRERV